MASNRGIRHLCTFVSLLLGIGFCRHAQAQVPEALYYDVREVITDLLTAEVAHSVVPQLACRGGRVEGPVPAGTVPQPQLVKIGTKYYQLLALYHYRTSLQEVYSRQFGSLRSSLLSESADLAGFLFYQELQSAAGAKLKAIPAVKKGDTT